MTSTFFLDGEEIPFQDGQTVLQAALSAGKFIPHLCWHPDLEPHSSCRLCTVVIDGRPFSSCTQPAMRGQKVQSETEDLRELRKSVTQMMFVEGNHYCPSCEKSGNCKLQATGYFVGMHDNRWSHQFPKRKRDTSHPEVILDRDRCIRCERCVRASRELDKKNVFAIHHRGIQSFLAVNSPSGLLKDTQIAADDMAVKLCPTGCLMSKQEGFQVPIGARTYDKAPISEVALAEFAAREKAHV